MNPIEDYFPQIVVINLDRRRDRWANVEKQLQILHMPVSAVHRFSAVDCEKDPQYCTPIQACTASHAAVLQMAVDKGWDHVLIFEDDFEVRTKETGCQSPLKEDAQRLFAKIMADVPIDWELLYFGGAYCEEPKGRVSPHVVIPNRIHCTSSYAVRTEFAKKLIPKMEGGAPDAILANLIVEWPIKAYVTQPRLFRQYKNYSDLERRITQGNAMDDIRHENMV